MTSSTNQAAQAPHELASVRYQVSAVDRSIACLGRTAT